MSDAKLMSSDESEDDKFVARPRANCSGVWTQVKSELDARYMDKCSSKSKRQMLKREIGPISEKLYVCHELKSDQKWIMD